MFFASIKQTSSDLEHHAHIMDVSKLHKFCKRSTYQCPQNNMLCVYLIGCITVGRKLGNPKSFLQAYPDSETEEIIQIFRRHMKRN